MRVNHQELTITRLGDVITNAAYVNSSQSVLAANNVAHFDDIVGLAMENWATAR